MKKALLLLALFGASIGHGQILINEFQPNPTGTDPANVDIELKGTPGALFQGWVISIESDATSPFGTVDRAADFTSNATVFDGNGLLVLSMPDLENPSFTVAITETFTGTVGVTTIETGGAPDLSFFGTIYDALGVPDNVGDEATIYGVAMGGSDFSYTGDEPQSVFRDGVTNAWYAVNDPAGTDVFALDATPIAGSVFDIDPTVTPSTFGSVNPIVPEPSTYAAILGLIGLAYVAYRRRK